MGMPRGSRWKRLAIFSEKINSDKAVRISEVLRASSIDTEWWHRTVPRGRGQYPARNPVSNLMRDASPVAEEWLMVRYGDWARAYIIARDMGVSL